MSEQFYFAVLRITCGQILRAAGIDRCTPALLDALTDICARHLDLLSQTSVRLANLSGREEPEVYDVALAMERVGLVRPVAFLDRDDIDPNSIEGFKAFIEWAKGKVPDTARKISRIQTGSINTVVVDRPKVKDGTMSQTDEPGTLWFNAMLEKARAERHGKLAGTVIDDDGEYNAFSGSIAGGPETIDEFMNEYYRRGRHVDSAVSQAGTGDEMISESNRNSESDIARESPVAVS
jgi:hypothetical protein